MHLTPAALEAAIKLPEGVGTNQQRRRIVEAAGT
jgi:hypothetical protein